MPKLVFCAALLLAPAALHAQEPSHESHHEAEVREVVRDFHAALAGGDSLRALGLLDPNVVIYEGGHAETLADYRSGHLRSDIAFAGAVRREVLDEAVTLWPDAALYMAEAHTSGSWRGRAIDSHGTETMVLVRTGDRWLIRHIHWSSR